MDYQATSNSHIETPVSVDSCNSGKRSGTSSGRKWKKSRKVSARIFKRKPSESPLRQQQESTFNSKRTVVEELDLDYQDIRDIRDISTMNKRPDLQLSN